MHGQMTVAASEDYGKDVSHVEMLIKTFDSFLQTIQSSEERVTRVRDLSQKVAKSKSFCLKFVSCPAGAGGELPPGDNPR